MSYKAYMTYGKIDEYPWYTFENPDFQLSSEEINYSDLDFLKQQIEYLQYSIDNEYCIWKSTEKSKYYIYVSNYRRVYIRSKCSPARITTKNPSPFMLTCHMIDVIKYIGNYCESFAECECDYTELYDFINRHKYGRTIHGIDTNIWNHQSIKNLTDIQKGNVLGHCISFLNDKGILIKYYEMENAKGNIIEKDWLKYCDTSLKIKAIYIRKDPVLQSLLIQIEKQNITINLLQEYISKLDKKIMHIPKKQIDISQ